MRIHEGIMYPHDPHIPQHGTQRGTVFVIHRRDRIRGHRIVACSEHLLNATNLAVRVDLEGVYYYIRITWNRDENSPVFVCDYGKSPACYKTRTFFAPKPTPQPGTSPSNTPMSHYILREKKYPPQPCNQHHTRHNGQLL